MAVNLSHLIRRRLEVFVVLAVAIVLIAGGGLAAFEAASVSSYGDGVYWALSLLTTVGFVGESPTSVGGRIIASVLMVSGFALMTLVTAAISSLFVREQDLPDIAQTTAFEHEVIALLGELVGRVDRLEAAAGAGNEAGSPESSD